MSKLIIVYIFHLAVVFPYLAYLGIQMDSKTNTVQFQQHGKILKTVAFMGSIYQAVLLIQYLRLIYG